MGRKRSLEISLKSFGRIICLPEKILFPDINKGFKFSLNKRKNCLLGKKMNLIEYLITLIRYYFLDLC